jgi:hypothetical protein
VFTSQDQRAGADVGLDPDRPLTLSQLSPEKVTPSRDPTPTPRDNVPDSPLRLPTKRSNSVASDLVVKKRKKSKTDTTSADVLTVMPKARVPVTKKYSKVPISMSSSSSSGLRFNRSKRRKPMSTRVNGPRIKQSSPVFKPQVPELDADAGDNLKDTSRTATSTSRLKNSNEKGAEPVNSITLNNKGKSIASSSHGSSRVVRVIFHRVTY